HRAYRWAISRYAIVRRLVGCPHRGARCGPRQAGRRRGGAVVTAMNDVRPVSRSTLRERFSLLPGIALLGVVGYAGKLTEQSIAAYGKAHQLTLPNIEYVLWAIAFGLVVSNTVGVPAIFRAGVATYEFWLKAGIVLLGVRFLLGDVVKLGGVSLVCVVLELALAIVVMTALGRWFKLSPKLTSLLAIGASICGVSAIIAAKGPSRRTTKTRPMPSPRFWRSAR